MWKDPGHVGTGLPSSCHCGGLEEEPPARPLGEVTPMLGGTHSPGTHPQKGPRARCRQQGPGTATEAGPSQARAARRPDSFANVLSLCCNHCAEENLSFLSAFFSPHKCFPISAIKGLCPHGGNVRTVYLWLETHLLLQSSMQLFKIFIIHLVKNCRYKCYHLEVIHPCPFFGNVRITASPNQRKPVRSSHAPSSSLQTWQVPS